MPGHAPYATYADMLERFGRLELLQLTDIDPDAPIDEPDQTMTEKALGDATELVNGYVAGRYAVPLTPIPDPVRRWTCIIARYYLHKDSVPERVREAYEEAVAALKDVAKGLITLQSEGEGTPAGDITGGSAMSAGPPKIFTTGSMKGF